MFDADDSKCRENMFLKLIYKVSISYILYDLIFHISKHISLTFDKLETS